jgi:hypothetical protein
MAAPGDFWSIDEVRGQDRARAHQRTQCQEDARQREAGGEWNLYRITVDHGAVTLEVNGEVLNQASEVLEVPGRIALQSEGAPIQFRNIRLTPLE